MKKIFITKSNGSLLQFSDVESISITTGYTDMRIQENDKGDITTFTINDGFQIISQRDKKQTGCQLIAAERKRQIEVEGWTADHDAKHVCGELTDAAVCYAIRGYWRTRYDSFLKALWPWDSKYWKPTQDDRIKELTKAGALIAAEIDRLTNTK